VPSTTKAPGLVGFWQAEGTSKLLSAVNDDPGTFQKCKDEVIRETGDAGRPSDEWRVKCTE